MRHCLFFSVSICISLISLHAQVISGAHFRNLNSGTSHNQKANIEIPINAEAADYHFSSFDDPSIFYCEKTLGALGTNKIISTVVRPNYGRVIVKGLNIAKSLAVTNLASPFFVGTENILSVSGNLLVVHGIQTDLERPRAQIIASLALNPKNENRKIDSVSFHLPNQHIAVLHGTKIEFYSIDGVNLDFLVEIESPVPNLTNLQDKQIFYFLNKFVFLFDKEAQKLSIYTVKNGVLTHYRTTENVQELFLDNKLAFIFTKDKLYTMDGENEVAVDFDRQVKGVVKASSTGVFVFSESRKDKKENANIQYVEIFEKKGFRINVIFTCPRNLKAMHLTTKNMYLVYENWVRIYPTVKDIQFNGEFFFDFVLTNPLAGVINTKAHDYLAIEDQENQVTLFSNDRTEFGLECKKEKGTAVAEYLFQIRCYTMKCDNVDFSAQKFANGSCAYTKNIMITPEEEGGTFGTVLLVGLGLIAGIAITIGFGAINCFGKASGDQNVKTHAPKAKDKKPFNINRGLRRPSHTPSHNQSHVSQFSHTNETRKFLHEGDESYPSEDMRESVQAMMNMKKKNTPMFETPRFTSFGGGISANLPISANHAKHLENVNEPEGEGSHLTKGSHDDEETGDSGENKKPIKMEKLKLGVFQNMVKDPTSFRNIGAPQNTNPSPDKKMEKEDGSKYSELQDENEEEEEEEDDEENENVKIDSGSGGEYMEGSFSK